MDFMKIWALLTVIAIIILFAIFEIRLYRYKKDERFLIQAEAAMRVISLYATNRVESEYLSFLKLQYNTCKYKEKESKKKRNFPNDELIEIAFSERDYLAFSYACALSFCDELSETCGNIYEEEIKKIKAMFKSASGELSRQVRYTWKSFR